MPSATLGTQHDPHSAYGKRSDIQQTQSGYAPEFAEIARGHGEAERERRGCNLQVAWANHFSGDLEQRPQPRMLARLGQRKRDHAEIPDHRLDEFAAALAHLRALR